MAREFEAVSLASIDWIVLGESDFALIIPGLETHAVIHTTPQRDLLCVLSSRYRFIRPWSLSRSLHTLLLPLLFSRVGQGVYYVAYTPWYILYTFSPMRFVQLWNVKLRARCVSTNLPGWQLRGTMFETRFRACGTWNLISRIGCWKKRFFLCTL